MKCSLLAILLLLLLTGCQGVETGEASSRPELGPPVKTARELLEEQPIDDTHDAFLVDTGGRMGTLLVTAELDEKREENEFVFPMTLSVWDPEDMAVPIQTMTVKLWVQSLASAFVNSYVEDVNFDGYSDIQYTYAMGVQSELRYCWIWNEKQGQFTEVPEYAEISSPQIDVETRSIYGWNRESAAGDGVSTIHQWVDGELVCVRRIEVFRTSIDFDSPFVLTVEDRIGGVLTEVFRTEFPAGSDGYFEERMKWEDLDYQGETESN